MVEENAGKSDKDVPGPKKDQNGKSDASEEGSVEIGACSLCHCALDFSDRAAFFKKDREEDYKEGDDDDSYFFRKDDPYLPESLWDPNNALVYCDSCDRMYHQKCHFVPVFTVPRGDWFCLYCQSQKEKSEEAKVGKKKRGQRSQKLDAVAEFFKEVDSAKVSTGRPFKTTRDLLFLSPPVKEVVKFEKKWEAVSRQLKAALWNGAFKQLKSQINGQLSTHRMAQSSLDTWTSTSHNMKFFHGSQELRQNLCQLFGSECKIRNCLLMVEARRASWIGEKRWETFVHWANDHKDTHAEFVERVMFPFGLNHQRRVEPKTPEFKLHRDEAIANDNKVPSEVALVEQKKQKTTDKKSSSKSKSQGEEDDNADGISLDSLTCCVCLESHATDDNDLVLCDGNGCFRAYHQHCVKPTIKLSGDDDDWFCPLCEGQTLLLQHVQNQYMGDEWEQRRVDRDMLIDEMQSSRRKPKQDAIPDDSSSLRSWANVDEVFPNCEEDHAIALALRRGERNAQTTALVRRVLQLGTGTNDDDDDDVEEDGHFDPAAFEIERQKERDENSEDASSNSSAATLVEMSSVEMEIGNDELAALREDEADNHDEEEGSKAGGKESREEGEDNSGSVSADDAGSDSGRQAGKRNNGRGMRLRSKRLYANKVGEKDNGDIGRLDEANILHRKRGRAPVDYILLNESLFGNLSKAEAEKIDGGADFSEKPKAAKDDNANDDGSDASMDSENKDKSGPPKLGAKEKRSSNGKKPEENNERQGSSTAADKGAKKRTLEQAPQNKGVENTIKSGAADKGKRAKTKDAAEDANKNTEKATATVQ